MGKAVGKIAIGAAIIGAAFLTGGASLAPTLAATASGATLSVALTTTALGSLALTAGASIALSGVAQGVGLGPKVPKATLSRLTLSFNPNAPRTMVIGGPTAMGTDVVYFEPSGPNDEYGDYIIVTSAHKATSHDTIYLDGEVLWTSAGGVQDQFVGYAWVTSILEGAADNTVAINGGATWGSDCRLTGCSYIHLRIKRTGNTKKAESPFAGGLSSRMTIIGKGIPVYDPRRDSTAGGSGPMRADDQSTWAFSDGGTDLGTNTALQKVTYELGWRIGGVVSVGAGLPAHRLDMADVIAAANICDETVSITGGGTRKRYQTHGVIGDDEVPSTVIETLCAHMCAEPRDTTGKLGLRMQVNDLSGGILELGEDDILSGVQWDPMPSLNDSINVVRGNFTDPGAPSLYQPAPYSSKSGAARDGVDRALTLDLPLFQNPHMAETVAEQVRRREMWRGRVTATFGPRALAVEAGQPVRVSYGPRGWISKVFRVERQEIRVVRDGDAVAAFVTMTLVEDDASVYSDAPTGPRPPAIGTPTYNLLNQPFIQAAAEAGTTANWSGVFDDNGNRPDDGAVNTRRPDALIGDRRVDRVIADFKVAAEALMRAALVQLERYRGHERLLYLDGIQLGTVIVSERTERVAGQTALAETFDLIGAKTPDGTAFVLDLDTVKVSPTQTLAAKFTELSVTTGFEAALSAAVTTLEEAIADEAEARASAITSLTASFGSALDTKASASALSSLTTTVSALGDTVTSQATALTSLTTTVDGNTSSVSFLLSAIDGNEGLAVLQTNSAGRAASIRVGGTTGDIEFQAENTRFRDAAGNLIMGLSSGNIHFYGKVYWNETIGRPVFGLASDSKPIDETITRAIDNDASVSIKGRWFSAGATGSTDITVQIQSRPVGGSWSNVGAPATGSTGVGEPGVAEADVTFTNTTGESQRFEFRAELTRSNMAAAVTTDDAKSYLRI